MGSAVEETIKRLGAGFKGAHLHFVGICGSSVAQKLNAVSAEAAVSG